MEIKEYWQLIWRKKQTILVLFVSVITIVAMVSVLQPIEYSVKAKIQVVPSLPEKTDPYTVARTTEYNSNLLAEISTTELFFNNLINSGFNIDKTYFGKEESAQLAKWQKTLTVKSLGDTGIIELTAVHTDKAQAEQIMGAAVYLFRAKHKEYLGINSPVSVVILDKPHGLKWPSSPNIIFNLGAGLFISLIVALSYIYNFPEKKYDLKIWPFTKKKKFISQNDKLNPLSEEKIYPKENIYDKVEDISEPSSHERHLVNIEIDDTETDNDVTDLPEHREQHDYSIQGNMDNVLGRAKLSDSL